MAVKTHFIVNRKARKLAQRPRLIRELEQLVQRRAQVWVTADLHELGSAARAMAAEDVGRVVLCGGDGTYMAGLTAVARAYEGRELPEFALAPAGTVATVARNWGSTGDVLAVARRMIDETPRVVLRPTLRVRERDHESRIAFTIGTGLVARFFDKYYSAGARGNVTALAIVARTFVGSLVGDRYARSVLDPLPCTLTANGVPLPAQAYSLVVCSVLRDLGLHMLVTYRGGQDPDRPHLVASALPPMRLGPQAPRVLLGRPLRGTDGYDGLVDGFTLRFPDGDGPYVLDGDVFRAAALTVTAGPQIRVAT